MISPPCVAMRSETLAVSMLVPPPTAANPSKSPSTAKSAAAWKESSVGSTRERSHTSTSMPSASINSRTRPVIPASTTPGSEVSITRPTPICFNSQPASSEAPGPYFSGVASMVKTVSLFDFDSLCMVMSFLSPRAVPDAWVPASFGKYTYEWERQQLVGHRGRGPRAMTPTNRQQSSPFAVDHVAYKLATRYAEQQTRQGSSDTRVPIRRPAIRWLYTVEAEKPIQISGSPERMEPTGSNGATGYPTEEMVGFCMRCFR